ncbi:MAG TPA: GNAT family N-acetyltransferase [Thermoanaerobaculia bacterium]|nr:GNAT family N-acetyltransferase [Thermoanaerobaculia bacterium]
MRGQRLHTRLTVPSDAAPLRELYLRDQAPPDPIEPASGMIGKIAGRVVAHLAFRRERATLEILHVHVDREYRRKRVARGMLIELERIAKAEGVEELGVVAECALAGLFRQLGFIPAGETLHKRVGKGNGA